MVMIPVLSSSDAIEECEYAQHMEQTISNLFEC